MSGQTSCCSYLSQQGSTFRCDSGSMPGTHNLPKQASATSAVSLARVRSPNAGTLTSCFGIRTALCKAGKFRTISRSTGHVRCLSKAGEEFPIRPKKRSDWELGPAFDLSQEQAVCMQLKVMIVEHQHCVLTRLKLSLGSRHISWNSLCLQALQQNDLPTADHGVEVLYRFADFDPFARSCYFG